MGQLVSIGCKLGSIWGHCLLQKINFTVLYVRAGSMNCDGIARMRKKKSGLMGQAGGECSQFAKSGKKVSRPEFGQETGQYITLQAKGHFYLMCVKPPLSLFPGPEIVQAT